MPPQRRALYSVLTAATIVAAACTYLTGNGRVCLWDRDEPHYAQTSKNMLESGDWVIPRFLGELRYAKPILIYWCQATSMALLGPGEFSARLVSVVAMTATLVVLCLYLWRHIGPQRTMLTILIFASSGLVIAAAKMCIIDSLLLLFITGMQICLFRLYWLAGCRRPVSYRLSVPAGQRRGTGIGWALVLWVCGGLAVLTKGPFALVLLLSTMIVLAVLDVGSSFRSASAWMAAIRWWGTLRPVIGMFIVVAIVGPWVIAALLRQPELILAMIGEPWRHASSSQSGHTIVPGYYLATIWVTLFPWSMLLPTALSLGWKHRRAPQIRFALAAVAGNWLFVEAMTTKLPHYMLPSFAALAFLAATALVRCVRGQHRDLHQKAFLWIAWSWAIGWIALAAMPGLAKWMFDGQVDSASWLLFAAGIVCSAVVTIPFQKRRLVPATVAGAAGMLLLTCLLFGLYLPHAAYLRLPCRVAEFLRSQNATAPGQVIMTGYTEPSLGFYQGGTIRERNRQYLFKEDPQQWPEWVVTTASLYESLPSDRKDRLRRLASFRGLNYNTGGKMVEVLVLRKTP